MLREALVKTANMCFDSYKNKIRSSNLKRFTHAHNAEAHSARWKKVSNEIDVVSLLEQQKWHQRHNLTVMSLLPVARSGAVG